MIRPMRLPPIIQGGMGAGVSNWTLARAVAMQGQFGVISGTALDVVLVRRLQLGDPGGHLRRALDAFPDREMADRIYQRYHVPGGKAADQPFKSKPMVNNQPSRLGLELLVAANFVEVYLAKEGHDGLVGINLLEKIQSPTLPSLYGAILAGVDAVIMGAGIPKDIPGFLDQLARNEPATLKLYVADASNGHETVCRFDPREVLSVLPGELKRPLFFPVISSVTLGAMLLKRATGRVDGLIVEAPTAGGHNAPPRGKLQLSVSGEPIYGPRDEVDLKGISDLGSPFWLAGSRGTPQQLRAAQEAGAVGIQVGTLFAFCQESGLCEDIKRQVIQLCIEGKETVFTDPVASPTGFPFKVLNLDGTHSEQAVYEQRNRICDLGYLREAYEMADGKLGWRCPSEPLDDYLRKGGKLEDTVGRKCLCNGLMANIGLGQVQAVGGQELPLLTCGDDTKQIAGMLRDGATSYSAAQAIEFLLSS